MTRGPLHYCNISVVVVSRYCLFRLCCTFRYVGGLGVGEDPHHYQDQGQLAGHHPGKVQHIFLHIVPTQSIPSSVILAQTYVLININLTTFLQKSSWAVNTLQISHNIRTSFKIHHPTTVSHSCREHSSGQCPHRFHPDPERPFCMVLLHHFPKTLPRH